MAHRYVDDVFKNKGDAHPALMNVAGVQFTVLSAILLAATFIPRGAMTLNPKLLFDEDLNVDLPMDDKLRGEVSYDEFTRQGTDAPERVDGPCT